MTLPPLWFIRHGETEWNRAGRMQGHQDSPLTETGRAQAAALGRMLVAETLPPDVVFRASPSQRVQDTAGIALAPLDRAPVTDPRLMEIGIGQCEGLTRHEIADRFPGLLDRPGMFDWLMEAPGGEGREAYIARCQAVLDDLTGPTVLFTHGITSRMLRALALGLGPEGMAGVPGGQGNIHVLRDGIADMLEPETV